MSQCDMCRLPKKREQLTHLQIYTTGSEGTNVCLECRILLGEIIRRFSNAMMKSKIHDRAVMLKKLKETHTETY